jgi:hypothetical protein
LPFGGRRAGLLANSFGPQVVGLSQSLYTGWVTRDDVVRYAPHTSRRLTVPPNRASMLLVNGVLARFGTAAANTVEQGPGGPSSNSHFPAR